MLEITSKLLETRQNKLDKKFWEGVITHDKFVPGYGSGETSCHYISGWIKDFFLFDKNGREVFTSDKLDILNMISSEVSVPVVLFYEGTGETKNLKYSAGFDGFVQEN